MFGPNGCGKTLVAQALANQLNIQVCIVNCWELIGDTSGATEARIRALLQKGSVFRICCWSQYSVFYMAKSVFSEVQRRHLHPV